MKAKLWIAPGCELCVRVRDALLDRGYTEIIERPASDLTSGEDRNHDALVQLAMQNMALPVVWVSDNGFIKPELLLPATKGT